MSNKTFQEEQLELNEGLKDFAFEVFDALGILKLCDRLHLTLKPWVRERRTRKLWASLTPETRDRIEKINRDLASTRPGMTVEEAEKRLRRPRG